MQIQATSVDDYLEKIPPERKEAMIKLRTVIKMNIPAGFEETMSYGMIGYVVPHSMYPDGYHCNKKLPLPFMNIASQKNFIAVYHMGIYANKELMDWFISEYNNHSNVKLDMGKSCFRFKKPEHIPFELLGDLASKMTCKEWITIYENQFKR